MSLLLPVFLSQKESRLYERFIQRLRELSNMVLAGFDENSSSEVRARNCDVTSPNATLDPTEPIYLPQSCILQTRLVLIQLILKLINMKVVVKRFCSGYLLGPP